MKKRLLVASLLLGVFTYLCGATLSDAKWSARSWLHDSGVTPGPETTAHRAARGPFAECCAAAVPRGSMLVAADPRANGLGEPPSNLRHRPRGHTGARRTRFRAENSSYYLPPAIDGVKMCEVWRFENVRISWQVSCSEKKIRDLKCHEISVLASWNNSEEDRRIENPEEDGSRRCISIPPDPIQFWNDDDIRPAVETNVAKPNHTTVEPRSTRQLPADRGGFATAFS